MTNPEKRLKCIERLWTLSKMDYVEMKWLLDRTKKLTEFLKESKARCNVPEHWNCKECAEIKKILEEE